MYSEKINQYIDENKDKMLKDVSRLVAINSEKTQAKEGMPYGEGPVKALQEALAIAKEMGFETVNMDNIMGIVKLNDKERQLDILAHLDVVPAGEDWTVTEPFQTLVKDGKIYGRGTADDKGPAIAALYALKAVKDLEIPLSKNAWLVLGTDEECGSSDLKYFYSKQEEAPMTFSPDGSFPVTNTEKGRMEGHFCAECKENDMLPRIKSIVCGEKINVIPGKAKAVVEGFSIEQLKEICDVVTNETKVVFELTQINEKEIEILAKGDMGHASRPEHGNNALTALLSLMAKLSAGSKKTEVFEKITALSEIFVHGDGDGKAAGIAMEDEISGKLSISLDILSFEGTKIEGSFDCRIPICGTEEKVLAVKEKLENKGFAFRYRLVKPHHVDGNSPFVKTLLSCYEKCTGKKGYTEFCGGGTYVHNLERGVAFGCSMPGVDNKMHGADEFAVIDDLITGGKIFAEAIVELCK